MPKVKRLAQIVGAGMVLSAVASLPFVPGGPASPHSSLAAGASSHKTGTAGTAGTAAKSRKSKARLPCGVEMIVKNSKFLHTVPTWPNAPEWRVSGWGTDRSGAPLSLSKSVQVSNSYTANVGVSAADVSASVGFNVTLTRGVTESYAPTLKKPYHFTLRAGAVYKLYSFDVYRQDGYVDDALGRCAPDGLPPSYVGKGYAQAFWTLDYKCTYLLKGKTRNCTKGV